jgi:hypothetical protein
MTQRKPPGVSFESWIDRQIREATERGEFDDLPGKGQPIRDLDRSHDELWWVKQKLQRENVSFLPPSLLLRKEVEDAMTAIDRARSERQVRRIVADINEKIRAAIRVPPAGPPVTVHPLDEERVVREWRARREAR